MNEDPASLLNLKDIVIPSPVSWWPPDTGGMLVLAGLIFCLTLIGLQKYLRYRKNRYRRAGLELIEDASTAQEISIILKRVALAAYPREQVASLYADEWVDFLNRTCTRTHFDIDTFAEPQRRVDKGLVKSAQHWISFHLADDPAPKEASRG